MPPSSRLLIGTFVAATLACSNPPPDSAGPPPEGAGAPAEAGAGAGGAGNAGPAPTATDAGPAGARVEVLHVDAKRVACTGVAPMQCLRVKRGGAGDWQLFYDPIEGFSFEEGNRYELKVRVEPVARPPADGSSLKYVLVEIVKKEPAR